MDKEAVVYTYNGILVLKRNTFESVLIRWMNLEPIIQREVSQKEKDKYRIQSMYMFLPGESQGCGSLVGFRLWGHTESDTTEAT